MKRRAAQILTIVGVILILSAVLLAVGSQVYQKKAVEKAQQLSAALRTSMPSPRTGALDDRTDTAMPMMELEGKNFIGVLESPQFDSMLPICESWSPVRAFSYPCRYMGSVYDRSLVIGGSGALGQLSFIRFLSLGDTLFFTDMTGACFSYQVADIRKTRNISSEALEGVETDFVLFARMDYSVDYIVVCCSLNAASIVGYHQK